MNRKKLLLALVIILGIAAVALCGCMPDRVTVSFDTAGGLPLSSVKIAADAETMELPVPEKEGHDFDYWCYDAEFTQRVDVTVIPDEDVTFYAKWTAKLITVTFNGNPKQYRYVPYGGSLPVSEFPEVLPVREGYVGRWLSGDLTDVTSPVSIDSEYVLSIYSVRFTIDGEEYYTAEGAPGDAVEHPADPGEDGSCFLGWYYDEAFLRPVLQPVSEIPSSDLTLYGRIVDTADMPRYISYSVGAGEATVTGLTSLGKNQSVIVIPAELGGYPVTAIGGLGSSDAFASRTISSDVLETVVVPSSVKSVGDFALSGLPSLRELILNEGLLTIGDGAFSGNPSLTRVTLPSSTLSVGAFAFAAVREKGQGEPELTLPGAYLWNRGGWTESGGGLASVSFAVNSSVKTIGAYAFMGNRSLTAFELPDSAEYVFDYAAFDESCLETVSSASPNYAAEDGAVYSSDFDTLVYLPLRREGTFSVNADVTNVADHAFYNNYNLASVVLPSGVKSIGRYAFAKCSALTSVSFGDASLLETIGDYAFAESKLESVSLPKTVTSVGIGAFREAAALAAVDLSALKITEVSDYAFYGCAALGSVAFSETTVSVGDYAFYGCASLSSLEFPSVSAMTSVGEYAFADCFGLTTVVLPSSLRVIKKYAFAGISRSTALEPSIPGAVAEIGDYAFMNTRTRSFQPTAALTAMGVGAFKNCTYLTRVRLPQSAAFDALPEEAFYNCTSLSVITVPANVRSLGDYAFYNCTNLSSAQFATDQTGNGVTSIGKSCFENCVSLTNGGDNYRILPSTLLSVGKRAFYNCLSITEITVPANLASVAEEAFARCVKLTSILYDAGCITDTLEENCFAYCTSLVTAVLPPALKLRGNGLGAVKNPFLGCTSLTNLSISENTVLIADNGVIYAEKDGFRTVYLYPAGRQGEFVADNSVTAIDDYAFYGSSVTGLSFNYYVSENGVEKIALVKIGSYAFAESTLNTAVLSRRVYIVSPYAFAGSRLASLTVEALTVSSGDSSYEILNAFDSADNILTLGEYSFAGTQLAEITLPARTKELLEGAFSSCYGLRRVTFDDGEVTPLFIGSEAFAGDSSLTSLEFPVQTSLIGDRAFADCFNVSAIAFRSSGDGELTVGAYAFRSNHYLYSVALPASLRSLGEGVFYDCSRLASVTFPSALPASLKIPKLAFYGCRSLAEFFVPHYVDEIGEKAFYSANISDLTFEESVNTNETLAVGASAFEDAKSLTRIAFPSDLKSIGEKAFYNSAVSVLDTGSAEFSLGSYAFAGTFLESVIVTDLITFGGSHVFADTPFLSAVIFTQSAAIVGEYAFAGSAVANVTFENAVREIGGHAFADTPSLTEITAAFDAGAAVGEYAFAGSALRAFTIVSVTDLTLKEGAFRGAASLESFVLSASEYSVGDFAFAGSGLSTLSVEGKAMDVGMGIAYSTPNLETVDISDDDSVYFSENGVLYGVSAGGRVLLQYPSGKRGAVLDLDPSVKEIADYAFYGNPYLTTLTVRSETVVTCGENSFGETNPNLTLYASEEQLPHYGDWSLSSAALQVGLNELVLTWLGGERYAVSGYTGTQDSVVVGGLMNDGEKNYRVERISANAFLNNVRLRTVTVGNGIKEIGEHAFAGCINLSSVALGENVSTVKAHAFDGCVKLTDVAFNDGLTSIGDYAFANCALLNDIRLPEGLVRIGGFAFRGSSSLTDVSFGSSLEEIGDNAFENAGLLVSVRLPSSLKLLRDYVFLGCDRLTFLYMDALKVPAMRSVNALKGTPSGLKIFVSDHSVREYRSDIYWREYSSQILSYNDVSKESGFENYVLTQIAPGEYRLVCYLGTESDVSIRTDINGAGTITEIGERCFSHFAVNVEIDEGVTAIASDAFRNAISLNSVKLPKSLVSIGDRAFYGLASLKTIDLDPASSLAEIGGYALYDCTGLTSFTFPSGLSYLGDFALSGAAMNLKEVVFAGLATVSLEIGRFALANNALLDTVSFDCVVTKLGDGAFSGCVSLSSVYLNSTGSVVAEISAGDLLVFEDCDQLSVFVPGDAVLRNYLATWSNQLDKNRLFSSRNISSDYMTEEGLLVHQSGFVISPIGGSSSVAAIVNYIGKDSEIVFPSSVTIGENTYQIERLGRGENNSDAAVNGRIIGKNVTKVVIPNTVKTISGDAFRRAEGLREVECAENSSLETIGRYAFAECPSLVRVALPKSLVILGAYAFYDCAALEQIDFENFLPSEIDKTSLQIGEHAFEKCASLTEITLPLHAASIANYAFYNNASLRDVRLPETGTLGSIGQYAFAGTGIAGISIPASVGTVGDSAFAYCDGLKYVRLTRTIGAGYSSLTTTSENVFRDISSPFVKVYVPEIAYTSYRDSAGWSTKTVLPDLTAGEFNYRVNGLGSNTVTLTHYLGSDKKIVIPSSLTIDHTIYRVTTISAYFGNAEAEEIAFASDSVISMLEPYAFAGCASLKKIHMPDGIQSMGDSVFEGCVSLEDVRLPSLLNSLPAYAFSGCTGLKEITVPSSVANVGHAAFLGCSSLNRLNIDFTTASPLGLSALVGADPSLVIVVPESRRDAFANEWSDYAGIIFDRRSVFGDFVVKENDTGYTLVQYNGRADVLDFTSLLINGRKITAVQDGAVIDENVEIIKDF